jgi:hypothetical protein
MLFLYFVIDGVFAIEATGAEGVGVTTSFN